MPGTESGMTISKKGLKLRGAVYAGRLLELDGMLS